MTLHVTMKSAALTGLGPKCPHFLYLKWTLTSDHLLVWTTFQIANNQTTGMKGQDIQSIMRPDGIFPPYLVVTSRLLLKSSSIILTLFVDLLKNGHCLCLKRCTICDTCLCKALLIKNGDKKENNGFPAPLKKLKNSQFQS